MIDPEPDLIAEKEGNYVLDGRVNAAFQAFAWVWNQARISDQPKLEILLIDALVDVCKFIRKVKQDATPQVLIQHLYLSKHIPNNEPCRVLEVALSCMAQTLLALDAHHDLVVAENQRRADLAAREAEPKWHQDDLSYGESDIAPNTF